MRLSSQHHFCIWCGKDLEVVGRSDEHIIPENIFGSVVTDDLCRSCNNNFGANLDHVLLNDGTTIATAFAAGVQPEELLARYRARQTTEDGLTIETSVRGGISAVVPQLDRVDGPLIGDRAGVIDPNQIRGMKRRTCARARANRPDLTAEEIEQRVERLYSQFLVPNAPDIVRDPEIGEALRKIVVDNRPVLFGDQADADLVSRAAGKIIYEALHSLVPFKVKRAMRPALSQLRSMVLGLQPIANIGHHRLERSAAREHRIKAYGRGDAAGCAVILFGNIEWRFSVMFQTPTGNPGSVRPFEVEIRVNF